MKNSNLDNVGVFYSFSSFCFKILLYSVDTTTITIVVFLHTIAIVIRQELNKIKLMLYKVQI